MLKLVECYLLRLNLCIMQVKGEIVVIKIDLPSSWTKMNGSSGPSNSASISEVCDLIPQPAVLVGNTCEMEGIVDNGFVCGNNRNLLEKKLQEVNINLGENGSPEPVGHVSNACVSRSLLIGYSREHNDVVTAVQRLCAMKSAYSMKH